MTTPQLTAPAVHEAGHVLVSLALGRGVSLVRLGDQALPADHPYEAVRGKIASGETRFSPDLVPAINERIRNQIPLTAEQRKWLWVEFITCFAGILAEMQVFGEDTIVHGWAGDVEHIGVVSGFLGVSWSNRAAELTERAQTIAKTVVAELADGLLGLAGRFSEGAVSFDQREMDALLEELKIRRGSHEHLLAGLT